MPRMLGISGRPTASADGKILEPMENYGIKCMSIGFLVPEDTPMIWRGPMVMSALQQMLRDVAWGELDIMVVDMPPGTGDAQLTMAQQVPLAGAVIVSTPQDIALIDARKGLSMFQKVDVPVLGIIENMSYFLCPHCGERSDIFSHGGARREAERLGSEFLGEVPLDIAIRETSDDGRPITVSAARLGLCPHVPRDRRAGVGEGLGRSPCPPRRAADRRRVTPPREGRGTGMTQSGSPKGVSPSQLIDARIEELGDWRGEMLGRLRTVVKEADPEIVEEWKWRGVPVWSHDGMICTGETYKNVVKMTFAKGATLKDPAGLFNASLDGNTRRAIDFHEGDKIDEEAMKALVRAAVTLNKSKSA